MKQKTALQPSLASAALFGRTASTWVELQGGGPAASFNQTNCGIGKIWCRLGCFGKLSNGWRNTNENLSNPSRTQLKYYSNVRNTVQWPPIWIGKTSGSKKDLCCGALGNVAVHQIYLSTHHVHANHLEQSAKEIPFMD